MTATIRKLSDERSRRARRSRATTETIVRVPALKSFTFPFPYRPFVDEEVDVGATVQLGFVAGEFVDDDSVEIEWLWVRVERRVEYGGFIGRLVNRPTIVPYRYGDLIRFNAHHVLAVEILRGAL